MTRKSKRSELDTNISEVDSLYNSNLFKLQIDELLGEDFSIPENLMTEIDKLKCDILKIPQIPSTSIEKLVEKYKCGSVLLPIPVSNFNQRHLFECGIIENVTVKYNINHTYTCENPIFVQVVLPFKTNLTEIKRRLFSVKRAIFLCNIVENLNHCGYEIFFTTSETCEYFPYVKVKNKDSNFSFILKPVINFESTIYDVFLPDKRNLKCKKDIKNFDFMETPFFNQCILRETILNNTDFSFSEGLVKVSRLLRQYLKNRPFGYCRYGIHDHHITYILSYLHYKNLIYDNMNPCQIIRVFFNFIANWFNNDNFSFYHDVDSDARFLLFKKYFNIVLLDNSGYINLLFDVSKNLFDLFVYDAKISFNSLNSNSIHSIFTFSNLFLTPIKFNTYFDMVFSINDSNSLWFKDYDKKLHMRSLIDVQYNPHEASLICIRRLIKRALKDRFILCSFIFEDKPTWEVNHLNENLVLNNIKFGLILKFPECTNLSIVGPVANNVKAIEFRRLYGELCKVFKFNDGTVNEVACLSPLNTNPRGTSTQTPIFNPGSPPDTPIGFLLRYILKYHCRISNLTPIFSQLDSLLALNSLKNLDISFQSIQVAFSEISSKLSLKDFGDFKIKNIIKCDPIFSKTSINSINFCDSLNYIRILIEVNISGNINIENSSLLKVYTLKVLLKIHENLKSRKVRAFLKSDSIEIRYKKFTFVLSVFFTSYLKVLYSSSIKNPDLSPLYLKNARDFHYRPAHFEFIHKFSEKYSSFSETVRILKIWVSAQLLIKHIPEQVLELIVAYIYENPFPYETPRHHFYGFMRALRIIGGFDWRDEILTIGFDISEKDLEELSNKFKKNRDDLPIMVINTPYDKNGNIWLDHKNNLLNVMLKRLIKIAKVSYEILEDAQPSLETDLKIQSIFTPNLSDFHIVIEIILNPSNSHQDFINFYNNLEIHFDDCILWLMDVVSPKYICGVFKTNTGEVNFNVTNCQHRTPVNISLTEPIKGKCRIDKTRIIEDIKLIGNGFCKNITIQI